MFVFYLRGPSLADLDLPLPWQRALEYGLGLARGRVYLKNFAFQILQCYLATVALMLAHDFSRGIFDVRAMLGILNWGLVVHIWLFVYSVPLIFFATITNAKVLKFLYDRRDYLPEEK